MTVNELIAKLQELAQAGSGELPVARYVPETDRHYATEETITQVRHEGGQVVLD